MTTFTNLQRKCPPYPKNTCPRIDDAIKSIRALNEIVNNAVNDAEDEFEGLRSSNSDLRDNAEYWRDNCEELANLADDQENQIVDLNSQLKDALHEIKDLQYQLKDLENGL